MPSLKPGQHGQQQQQKQKVWVGKSHTEAGARSGRWAGLPASANTGGSVWFTNLSPVS